MVLKTLLKPVIGRFASFLMLTGTCPSLAFGHGARNPGGAFDTWPSVAFARRPKADVAIYGFRSMSKFSNGCQLQNQ